jgi:hypothetical protein
MANIKQVSLVLHGSAVAVCVGKAGNARRGTRYTANRETPEIRNSMRHPSLGGTQAFPPAMRPDLADDLRMDSWAVFGAGRSHRLAGVLSCRGSASRTTSNTTLAAARSLAAIVVVKRWSVQQTQRASA